MPDYKVKIITNKAVITSAESEFTKKTFEDIYSMVQYVNQHKIKIVNPEALPLAFQSQLTTNQ